jgi:formylglycine-generating enzyme required for sulfatase activity
MRHSSYPGGVNRQTLIQWFRGGRERTRNLFTIPRADSYHDRPIRLRNPIVFYEGHLPVFTVNTLIKLALKQPGIDEHYEDLFARGIDPDSDDAAKPPTVWPARNKVQDYGTRADALIESALGEATIEDSHVPQLRGAEAAIAILEHEQMHQETLLYMFHEMAYQKKVPRAPFSVGTGFSRSGPAKAGPHTRSIRIPAGVATVGGDSSSFGWDNEFPAMRVEVPGFEIDRHNVTNGEYLEYIRATDADPPHFWLRENGTWCWRGMFQAVPLPLDSPVYVTYDEASAYARWRGKRLPSEAEYHRAAFGTPSGEERMYPWGNEQPDETRGNFGFTNWDPVSVGSYPAGASAWGVHDLVGNGWEWTSTIFGGFPGFQPMPSYTNYSVDFFDSKHYVLKGASPGTARELVRRSFRNWFRPNYPYVYATFRCAA